MNDIVLYIHGKGGSAAESKHYRPLFSKCGVIGLDYHSDTPWEAGAEILDAVVKLKNSYRSITLIANSIGAFFSMHAGIGRMIDKAFFISPIVDMERLIRNRMALADVTEEQLKERGVVSSAFGEDLSWAYLQYVREHPIRWTVPTAVLYGSSDKLTDRETMEAFAKAHGASLTVMENGEHWFHTQEQMRFLDEWIRECGARFYPRRA